VQPATSGNAPQLELPEIVFVSPEEALVQTLLWMSVAAAMPLGVLIAANLLTGRDPARALRDALAERLATSARFCAKVKGAELELEAQAFEGTAGLHKLHDLAGLTYRGRRLPVASVSLIDEIGRLGLLLLAWLRVGDNARDALVPAAAFCRSVERAVRTGEAPRGEPAPITATGATRPLGEAISNTLNMIAKTLTTPPAAAPAKARDMARSPRRLLAADAFSNPEHVHFCPQAHNGGDDLLFHRKPRRLAEHRHQRTHVLHGRSRHGRRDVTQGDTAHRWRSSWRWARLGRDSSADAVDDKSRGPIPVACAGDPARRLDRMRYRRVAYAGVQIGLAFYLVVLHGTGPTVDMYTARDRIIGILLGNIVIFVIFTTIWPASAASVVRTNVAKALAQLAALGALGGDANGSISQSARSATNQAFGQAIAQARAVLVNDRFETSEMRRAATRRRIDATVVARIGRLLIPVSIILDLIASPAWRDLPQPTRDAISAYQRVLAEWFRRAASWVRNGEGAAVADSLPEPPPLSGTNDCIAAFAAWSDVLDQDIRKILNEIGPPPESVVISPARDVLRAAG
jgi:multidrug resistance protein MdtO